MASFNKVILVGHLTRDPEVKYLPSGTAVAELGLALNRTWKDANGGNKEDVTFVNVTMWGRTAEIAGQYLTKGRPVLIEGRLQLDSWTDKDTGNKRTKLKVVGEHMTMLGSKGGGEQSQEPNGHHDEENPAAKIDAAFGHDTEVPF